MKQQTIDLDNPATSLKHRDIILRKASLKKLYTEWYLQFQSELQHVPEGVILEIGSGGGFIKSVIPKAVTSDIMPLPTCDLCMSADKIDFPDNSVSAIFMLNVLHHIPNVKVFFAEAQRVLKKDGIIFMIEPANTTFSRFIYRFVHHEPFETNADWHFNTTGPLSGANGAIPWIVFVRDRAQFEKSFPLLKLQMFRHHTPFRYLLIGGLRNFSFLPGFMFRWATCFEKLFSPLFPRIGLFQTIKLQKNG